MDETRREVEEASFEVVLHNGDRASALTERAVLAAARQLCEDASQTRYGVARLFRQKASVYRDDVYDGRATALAREGRTQ